MAIMLAEANARITSIKIGSSFHDGRGFFTVTFEGQGWGQGAQLPFTVGVVDALIRIARAPHLFSVEGKFCVVLRKDKRESIDGIKDILGDGDPLIWNRDED